MKIPVKKQGFALVELAIVVAIVGVISTGVLMAGANQERQNLDVNAQTVQATYATLLHQASLRNDMSPSEVMADATMRTGMITTLRNRIGSAYSNGAGVTLTCPSIQCNLTLTKGSSTNVYQFDLNTITIVSSNGSAINRPLSEYMRK
ncbi:MAG: type II secretion system protein [Vampirovibrionales bacterium]